MHQNILVPPDQWLLYEDLIARLDHVHDTAELVRFMGEILRSLLRRKGDAEFLVAIQDAFSAGLADRAWPDQAALARDVIRVIIEKRPEIARAWQSLHADEGAESPVRRASDIPAAASPVGSAPVVGRETYRSAEAEKIVIGYVHSVLTQRLDIFRVPAPAIPSMAYCHERPFFLFDPRFEEVVKAFVGDVLMVECRPALERHVYRHISPRIARDPEKQRAVLAAKRPEVWKILTERLLKLSALHISAEAKLAAAKNEPADAKPRYRIAEVPVTRPRIYRVLGVEFALGKRTEIKKVRVKARPPHELDRHEREAVELMARFRDLAAGAGLDLPVACDFQFLRTLFDFDAKKYAQATKEFLALAGHSETTRQYLLGRLNFIDKTYPNVLADALILMMFRQHSGGCFGFQELYDTCVGAARVKSAVASKRPFLQMEIERRPRELACQIREALRSQAPWSDLEVAIDHLFQSWRIMARTRFQTELEASIAILRAFPVTFGSAPYAGAGAAIGAEIATELKRKEPKVDRCLAEVRRLYQGVTAHAA